MDAIADRYADRAVRSVFIYTREAHPGEEYRHHTSMEVKRHHASALRDVVGIRRPVLIDGLERRVKGDKLPFYSERLSWRVRDDETFRRLLERCGPQAVSDFFDKR
jgi:hypothetical protein